MPATDPPQAENQPKEMEDFQLTREGTHTIEDLFAKLRGSYSFFSEMSQQELVWFLRLCSRRSYEAGEVIFQEGEIGDCFFLIVFGEVTITRKDAAVAKLRDGNCFGEMAVLERAPRNATATATGKTLVFCVERDILTNVSPSLGFKVAAGLARDLSQKLREADKKIKGRSARAKA
ncbi:MAG: cyclic nucleotide-binding domain-containing protein [Nitrospinota bacterium]